MDTGIGKNLYLAEKASASDVDGLLLTWILFGNLVNTDDNS